MSIPGFQMFMRPVLDYAAAHDECRLRDVYEAMADRFELTDDDRRELLPSGRQPLFQNRIAWAVTHLKKANLLEPRSRGVFAITERGRAVLENIGDEVTLADLNQFEEFREFRKRGGTSGNDDLASAGSAEGAVTDVAETPEEALAGAWRSLDAALEVEVLNQVLQVSPSFFERLVVDVLVSMGYGGNRVEAARAVGKSGDGGVDGVIDEDPLGLDTVYLQAKRWEGSVGRPEIQKFAGALQGMRARKGVVITTSEFTREAREYVRNIENRIVLIDGQRLARLMIDHDVGVSETTRYVVKQVDQDYFAGD